MLRSGAASLGIKLSDKQLLQFDLYKNYLIEYNKKVNLTRICEEKDIIIKHFLDCLFCIQHIDCKASLADVGSGAGFPGIVIKIAMPEIRLTLIDSLMKRVKFLECLTKHLEICDVEIHHIRGEDAAKQRIFSDGFDFVTSRAVASIDKLCKYQLPLVRPGGYAIMMKGVQVDTELLSAQQKIMSLGFLPAEKFVYTIPHSDISHCILKLKRKSIRGLDNKISGKRKVIKK